MLFVFAIDLFCYVEIFFLKKICKKFIFFPFLFEKLPKIENMRQWLEDPRAVDQYVIRFGDRTEIYWVSLSLFA